MRNRLLCQHRIVTYRVENHMDESSRNGIVSGVLLVVISIMIGGGGFIDVPFLSIVLGGTIAAVFINFGFEDILGVMKLVQKILSQTPKPAHEYIGKIDNSKKGYLIIYLTSLTPSPWRG